MSVERKPGTLASIAGLPASPAPAADSVLLMIDPQLEYSVGRLPLAAALDHGYRSTVVANATATRDLPHPLGAGVVPAAAVHIATLAALSDRFSVVVQDTDALSNT